MSILADGIFMNPRYDQYEDYGETQSYYDLRTGYYLCGNGRIWNEW